MWSLNLRLHCGAGYSCCVVLLLAFSQNLKQAYVRPVSLPPSTVLWGFFSFLSYFAFSTALDRFIRFGRATGTYISLFVYRRLYSSLPLRALPAARKYTQRYLSHHKPTVRIFFTPQRFLVFLFFFKRVLFLPALNRNSRFGVFSFCSLFRYLSSFTHWL